MKPSQYLAALSLMAAGFRSSPIAAQSFDQNIVAIFGNGNPNNGWTANSNGEITLALRAKNRETASTANAFGVYFEPVGLQAPNNNRARWNWEFSINSSDVNLDAYDYYVAIDIDPSVAIDPMVVNALTYWSDNSYGDDDTLNGQGVEGTAAQYASQYNIAQQSQNLVFAMPVQFASLDATYTYSIYSVQKGASSKAKPIVSVQITVEVGNGGKDAEELVADLAENAKNHGDYVKSVEKLIKDLVSSGVITKSEGQTILAEAKKSSVGKK